MTEITPYVLYEDAEAAVGFLTRAFGGREYFRTIGGAGGLHVELRLDDEPLMLGRPPSGYESPARTGHSTALVHVYLDDVDARFEHAKAARGDLWSFATPG